MVEVNSRYKKGDRVIISYYLMYSGKACITSVKVFPDSAAYFVYDVVSDYGIYYGGLFDENLNLDKSYYRDKKLDKLLNE